MYLIGHEPDNEDSDQSEGSYLPSSHTHRPVEYLNIPASAPQPPVTPAPPTPRMLPPRPLAEPPLQPETEADMEKFAADNLNLGGGLFRRKASVREMLRWSGRSLARPLLASSKQFARPAADTFR